MAEKAEAACAASVDASASAAVAAMHHTESLAYVAENPEKAKALARVYIAVRKADSESTNFYGVSSKQAGDAQRALSAAEKEMANASAQGREKWLCASVALEKAHAEVDAAEAAAERARDDMCAAMTEASASMEALEAFHPTTAEWRALLIVRPTTGRFPAAWNGDPASWPVDCASSAHRNTDDDDATSAPTPADHP
jgi:hypothetical protein